MNYTFDLEGMTALYPALLSELQAKLIAEGPLARLPRPIIRLKLDEVGPQAVRIGPRQYRFGNDVRELASDDQDRLLLAMIDHNGTASLKELIARSGVRYPRQMLQRIRKGYDGLFSPFIHFPGRKGNGGFKCDIRRAPQT